MQNPKVKSPKPKSRIFVLGYPSSIGGADTELWHVLRLWRRHGLEVTLLPTWRASPEWRRRCDAVGARTIEAGGVGGLQRVDGLPGAIVVSFCNRIFLEQAAPRLRELDCRLVWVNCMTWLFPAEKRHYLQHGPFDAYVFQSEYQAAKLRRELEPFGVDERQCFRIPGAMSLEDFPFAPREHPPGGEFVVGRLARPDADKWSSNTWPIYDAIPYAGRRARLMGWNDRLASKLGQPPSWAEVLPPCAEPPGEFLRRLHCLMPINGGAAENWPRVGLEAMAAGVPIIAQDAWGWREMIDHGRTGYLAADDGQLAYYAAHLAMNEPLRLEMAAAARRRVEQLADPAAIFSRWQALLAACVRHNCG